MGRQAPPASRSVQKWQPAANRLPADASHVADFASEDEHGGSTRMPSSGAASPSASSAELGRQGVSTENQKKTAAQIQKENDDRARWADVESDGEDTEVREGGYRGSHHADDEWANSGKKSKNAKQKARIGKMDLPPPCPPPNEAPRQVASRQSENLAKTAAYRPPKEEVRHTNAYLDSCYEKYDESPTWEASSWGSSARGGGGGQSWSSSKRGGGGGSGWDEGSWSQKAEVRTPKPDISASRKGRGGGSGGGGGGGSIGGGGGGGFGGGGAVKEKNESFKRGPHVTTNMDSSRLSW